MTELYNVFATHTTKNNSSTSKLYNYNSVFRGKDEKKQRLNRTVAKKVCQINKSEHLSQCRMSATMITDDNSNAPIDRSKNEESPALGQATGPSNFTSGNEQYNAETFVRQVADAELGDSTLKLVLFTIGLYADDEAICSETKTHLAEKTGLNRNVISQKIDKAAALGWLKIEFQHPKSRRSDWPVYRILMQF